VDAGAGHNDRVTGSTRGRSAAKRAAILEAARQLFLADGYDRTSVDAIAAKADVSKRTVYDHFGDKEAVYAAVIGAAGRALLGSIEAALTGELEPARDLREALLGFARRIATRTFPSSEYATFRALTAADNPRPAHWPAAAGGAAPTVPEPEQLLVERFAEYARAGRLEAPNPHRAAEHFIALTLRLALEARPADVDAVLVDGVDAFLRAYAPRP